MRSRAPALLCLLLLTSCATERADAPLITGNPVAPIARDSAGISIFEHAADARAAAPQLTVDTVPLTVIGARPDGSDDVTRVWPGFLLPDNAIAFWHDQRAQLFIYEPDGRLRRRVGRRGQGPEDFASVHYIGISGDTLLVPDFGNDRLSLYDAALNRVGVMRGVRACQTSSPIGRLPGGGIVGYDGWVFRPAPPSDTVVRPPTELVQFEDTRCDTLRVLPGRELRVVETRRQGRRHSQSMLVHFGRMSAAAVWDTLVAVGTADEYRIDLLDSSGSVVNSIRADFAPVPVPDGARDTIIARRMAELRAPGTERRIDPIEDERLIREATFVADSVAVYEYFRVSHDGLLWVVEGWAPGMPERSATAFRRDGSIAAHLRMPADLIPMSFGSDRVLFRKVDPETDIATFRSLRLIPRSP